MEYLKNVLIKEADGIDYVFIVDNLPKELLTRPAKKLVFVPRGAIDYDPQFPKQVEAYVLRSEFAPDEPRNRRLTGEMVDELLPGIEKSQTDDGAYVFFTIYGEARDRLAAIDRYIRSVLPPMAQVPRRVPYSSVPKSFIAPPRSLDTIPRVVLPLPVSPPAQAVQVMEPTPALTSEPLTKRGEVKTKTEAELRADRIKMEKVRKAKKAAEREASIGISGASPEVPQEG